MAELRDLDLLSLVTSRLLTDYPNQMAKCLRALGEDDIWWRPNEQSNAVGNLVLHLAGSNRFYFEHVIGGAPNVRNRDAEFAARSGRSKADLLALWTDATAAVERVMGTLTRDRLGHVTGDRNRSVAEVLLHVTHHNSLHIGQIVWVTKMRKPGVF